MLHRWIWWNKYNCNWLMNPRGVLCDPRWHPAVSARRRGSARPDGVRGNGVRADQWFWRIPYNNRAGGGNHPVPEWPGKFHFHFWKIRIWMGKKKHTDGLWEAFYWNVSDARVGSNTRNWSNKIPIISQIETDPWVCIRFAINLMGLKLYEKLKALFKSLYFF